MTDLKKEKKERDLLGDLFMAGLWLFVSIVTGAHYQDIVTSGGISIIYSLIISICIMFSISMFIRYEYHAIRSIAREVIEEQQSELTEK